MKNENTDYDDCFVTDKAAGLSAELSALKVELKAAGNVSEFLGLFRISDGKRVAAKLFDGKYGQCWALCDQNGSFIGEFINHSNGSKRSAMFKNGYETRMETAPARAKIFGCSGGLVGLWSGVAGTVRTDSGYPTNAIAF